MFFKHLYYLEKPNLEFATEFSSFSENVKTFQDIVKMFLI